MSPPRDPLSGPSSDSAIGPSASRKTNILLFFGAVLAGALGLAFLEIDPLLATFASLSVGFVAAAAACVVLSFILGAMGLAALTRRRWSANLHDRGVFRITVLSQIAANLFSFGGLTGATMRARLLSGREGRWPEAVVAAVIFTFALNGTSIAISTTAIVLLLLGRGFEGAPILAGLGPIVISGLCASLIVGRGEHISRLGGRLIERLGRHLGGREFAQETHNLLLQALEDRASMFLLTGFILADWFAMAFALGCAFSATGHPVSFEALIACFGAGALATLLSFIPGGVGVLEASMVGVAVMYGVPKEAAAVAVLLYRVLYYGIPIPLSLIGMARR